MTRPGEDSGEGRAEATLLPVPAMRIVRVLGTPLCSTTHAGLSDYCHRRVGEPGVLAVDFTNTHIVTMRRLRTDFRRLTLCFDHFVPDGMPLVWCMKRIRPSGRVYGPEFLRECLGRSPAGCRHFFLGGSRECLRRLEARVREINPDLDLVGSQHGYFAPEEEEAVVERINALSPDFVWVGLGTPRQQQWIARWKSRIRRGVLLSVGYAFDVNAGTKPDSPGWMQQRGLGWLFRWVSEPRRLTGRYLKYNSLFLAYLLWDGIRGRAVEVRDS